MAMDAGWSLTTLKKHQRKEQNQNYV
jgi:hypothetical protein